MPDVFLSYNREDQDAARRFAEAFQAHGLDVWWDTALRSGEAYDQVTEKALRDAKAVVVLWSKRSVESRWVRAEATLADRNGTLVPCMIEPCERPIMFELTQTAELAHWKGAVEDKAWLGFLADVRGFVKRTPLAAPAPTVTLRQIAAEPAPKQETTLAVLPFDNVSNDADMVFFSDGVSEDILTRLSRGSSLKLIGKTSSFQFRGGDKPKAAAALKATHVLDGSIRRAANKVRIAAHLTDAATQTMLWSDKYDRDLEDVFAVQDEISEAISNALNATFFPAKTTPIDPATYDLFLRARDPSPNPAQLAERVAMLEQVTRAAPDFAEGWGALAGMRALLSHFTPYAERSAIVAQVRAEGARAAAIDPGDVWAVALEHLLLNPFGDYVRGAPLLAEMRERGKNNAFIQGVLAYASEALGHGRVAVEHGRSAFRLDPLDVSANVLFGQALWRTGQYAEGRAVMARTLAANPDDHHTSAQLIMACAQQGDWAAVDALIDPARLAQYPLREHMGVIVVVAILRDPTLENRRALFDRMRQRTERTGNTDAQSVLFAAHLGFVEETFDMIEHAKFGPSGGPRDILGVNAYRTHLLFTAAYPELRNDPRFVKLCARLGLVEYWLATQKWPDCAEVTPYDFRAECEKYRDYPKDVFFAG